MSKSRVDRDKYIVLQGFMISDLKLKGNELIIYACIYGFSQAENQVFSGSLQYLADWTNSSKQSVIKCLKSLIAKGYITKNEKLVNGVKFCEYYATKLNGVLNFVEWGSKQSLIGGSKQSLPNNIDIDNIDYNIYNNIVDFQENEEKSEASEIYKPVIDYLNAKASTSFRSTSKETQKHIRARVADGNTLEDFKTVIDNMCVKWKGTDFEQYLRPSTLFGTKFENYLNMKPKGEKWCFKSDDYKDDLDFYR